MFWTAFVWGLGVTVGGSIGLMLFVMLLDLFKRIAHSKVGQEVKEMNAQTLEALRRRNELTEQQLTKLDRIGNCLDAVAQKD